MKQPLICCCECGYPILSTGTAIDGKPSHIECYWKVRGDRDKQLIDGLITKIRDLETKVAELSETYVDENGTVWNPPTAWAYAQTCKALHKAKEAQGK